MVDADFNFNMPKIEMTEESEDGKYGKFVVEPLERGYGLTLGNSLRRIMLSSLVGTAVSSVKIDGVLHEFSSIPGVKEDVTEIILNIKKLAIKNNSNSVESITAHIDFAGEGVVKASDIKVDPDIEIVNPDLVIAHLNGGADCKLSMELTITNGRGYVSSEKNKHEDMPAGVIAVDSIYTPVERVNMAVQNLVGKSALAGVPPLADAAQAAILQPFQHCLFVCLFIEHHDIKLDGAACRDFLGVRKADTLALCGLRTKRPLAFADLAVDLNGNHARLYKDQAVDDLLIGFQGAGFLGFHACQHTAGVFEKAFDLIIVQNRLSVGTRENGFSLFGNSVRAECCDLILNRACVRGLACDKVTRNVLVARPCAKNRLQKC